MQPRLWPGAVDASFSACHCSIEVRPPRGAIHGSLPFPALGLGHRLKFLVGFAVLQRAVWGSWGVTLWWAHAWEGINTGAVAPVIAILPVLHRFVRLRHLPSDTCCPARVWKGRPHYPFCVSCMCGNFARASCLAVIGFLIACVVGFVSEPLEVMEF